MVNLKKCGCFAAAVLLLSGLWLDKAVGDEDGVVHSNLQWHCPDRGDEKYCAVSFELVNQTSAPQVRKVTIRGIHMLPGKKDADGKTCGQINFSILLEPQEVIEIREMMPVESMPDEINVLIWG
jgi:hypothetical protein